MITRIKIIAIWLDKRFIISKKAQNCATLAAITGQSFDYLYNTNHQSKSYVNTYDRLKEALTLLGYSDADQVHHKSNLIHAIQQFAAQHNDTELEARCEAEIVKIRANIQIVAD